MKSFIMTTAHQQNVQQFDDKNQRKEWDRLVQAGGWGGGGGGLLFFLQVLVSTQTVVLVRANYRNRLP